jgi:hypothetical protein
MKSSKASAKQEAKESNSSAAANSAAVANGRTSSSASSRVAEAKNGINIASSSVMSSRTFGMESKIISTRERADELLRTAVKEQENMMDNNITTNRITTASNTDNNKDNAGKSAGKELTLEFARTLLKEEFPNELLAQGQKISAIGDLGALSALRKLDVSFNDLSSLDGLDKLPKLRELNAYCCRITDIEGLVFTSKLVTLRLQQNGVTQIINCFNNFLKLRDLRLDHNRINTIQNLSRCSSLRTLDLSCNRIQGLEGLAGLQSLAELNLSKNEIASLKPLRALPSMTELDVSFNKLLSLEGIQNLPTLQVIKAGDNELVTLRIPQTYSTHQMIDKLNNNSESGSVDNSSNAKKIASSKKAVDNKKPPKPQAQQAGATANAAAAAANNSNNNSSAMSQYLGMTDLTEVYVANNNLKSLDGIDSLGVSIEVLDVTRNRLDTVNSAAGIASMVSCLAPLKKLQDIKLRDNPGLEGSVGATSSEKNLMECILNSCPSVLSLDGKIIREVVIENDELLMKDVLVVPDDLEPSSKKIKGKKGGADEEDDDDDNSDYEDDHNAGRAIPTLSLKDFLTEEQIAVKEREISDLLMHSKETLQLASTVFAVDYTGGETRNDAAVEALTKALETKLNEGFKLVNDIKVKKKKAAARDEARKARRAAAAAAMLEEEQEPQQAAAKSPSRDTRKAKAGNAPADTNVAVSGDSIDLDADGDADDASSVGMTFLSSTKNVNVLVAQTSRPSTSNAGTRPGSSSATVPQTTGSRPISAQDVLLSGVNSQRRASSGSEGSGIAPPAPVSRAGSSRANAAAAEQSSKLASLLQESLSSFKPTSTTVDAVPSSLPSSRPTSASSTNSTAVDPQVIETRKKRFQALAAAGVVGGIGIADTRHFDGSPSGGGAGSRPLSGKLGSAVTNEEKSPRMMLEDARSRAKQQTTAESMLLLSGVKSMPALETAQISRPTSAASASSAMNPSAEVSPRENLK